MTRKIAALPLLTLLATASVATAHPGHASVSGTFSGGVVHPLSGGDHVLAMLAVGLLAAAAARGRRWLWVLPVTFLALMCVGGLFAAIGISLPLVEQGLAASVLTLGVLIIIATRVPLWATAMLVGLFALFHGHAHVAERPAGGLTAYAAGFLIATAGLHAVGLVSGLTAMRLVRPAPAGAAPGGAAAAGWARACGGTIGACGVVLLAGSL